MWAYEWVGGEVEGVEGFEAWEFGFEYSSLTPAFVADVDLEGECLGEERRVGQALFDCMRA